MRWWKVLGVAAFVGVAAGGVLVARTERRYHDYSPEEIRERLHARAAEALGGGPAPDVALDLPVALEPAGTDDLGEVLATVGQAAPDAPAPDAPPPDAPAPEAPTHAPRRVGIAVNHLRTRLGVRPLPTRRRLPRRHGRPGGRLRARRRIA